MASGVDIIARGLGAKGLQEADRANARLDALPKGLVYRGAVDYYSDLPSGAEVGDVYTVKYEGTSGTTPNGDEYAWGVYESINQWIKIGKDYESLAPEEGGVAVSLVTTGEKYFWNNKTDLFECTYGTTTYADITTALSAGKIPYCFYSNRCYIYQFTRSDGIYYFSAWDPTLLKDYHLFVLTNGGWSLGNKEAEDKSNKVTSISASSTDIQYPSAKAVYDTIENGKEIFYCTYGTTTYAEITTAISNGKLPVCIYSDRFYKYDLKSPTDRYIFNAPYADSLYSLNIQSNDTWGSGNYQFEIISNKVKSISNTSTDTQYPSAKCVYDELAGKQDVLVNQENIKSINGETLLGSGDIEIPTYSPFKSTWRNDTVAHLLTDINADVTATEGKSYLGEVLHVTATEGLFNGNAEILVNIMRQISTTNKIIWCIVSSNNVDPYHWEATFSNGSISAKGWTPFVPGTRTIAGVDLKDDITKLELQTALDWSTKANDNEVVHKADAETITGIKTFDNQVVFSNSSAAGTNNLTLKNDNGYNAKIKMGNTENIRLMTTATYFGTSVGPTTDNSYDLGTSQYKWKDMYLAGKLNIDNYTVDKDQFGQLQIGNTNTTSMQFDGSTVRAQNIVPMANNQKDLGSSSMNWKDLYLAGKVDFDSGANITKDGSNRLNLNYGNDAKVKVGSAEITIKNRMGADTDNAQDIGRDTVRWKDIYLAGNLSDGTNSISIANITAKSTVSVSSTGTATDEVEYITINGVEKKLKGGTSGVANGVAYEIL